MSTMPGDPNRRSSLGVPHPPQSSAIRSEEEYFAAAQQAQDDKATHLIGDFLNVRMAGADQILPADLLADYQSKLILSTQDPELKSLSDDDRVNFHLTDKTVRMNRAKSLDLGAVLADIIAQAKARGMSPDDFEKLPYTDPLMMKWLEANADRTLFLEDFKNVVLDGKGWMALKPMDPKWAPLSNSLMGKAAEALSEGSTTAAMMAMDTAAHPITKNLTTSPEKEAWLRTYFGDPKTNDWGSKIVSTRLEAATTDYARRDPSFSKSFWSTALSVLPDLPMFAALQIESVPYAAGLLSKADKAWSFVKMSKIADAAFKFGTVEAAKQGFDLQTGRVSFGSAAVNTALAAGSGMLLGSVSELTPATLGLVGKTGVMSKSLQTKLATSAMFGAVRDSTALSAYDYATRGTHPDTGEFAAQTAFFAALGLGHTGVTKVKTYARNQALVADGRAAKVYAAMFGGAPGSQYTLPANSDAAAVRTKVLDSMGLRVNDSGVLVVHDPKLFADSYTNIAPIIDEHLKLYPEKGMAVSKADLHKIVGEVVGTPASPEEAQAKATLQKEVLDEEATRKNLQASRKQLTKETTEQADIVTLYNNDMQLLQSLVPDTNPRREALRSLFDIISGRVEGNPQEFLDALASPSGRGKNRTDGLSSDVMDLVHSLVNRYKGVTDAQRQLDAKANKLTAISQALAASRPWMVQWEYSRQQLKLAMDRAVPDAKYIYQHAIDIGDRISELQAEHKLPEVVPGRESEFFTAISPTAPPDLRNKAVGLLYNQGLTIPGSASYGSIRQYTGMLSDRTQQAVGLATDAQALVDHIMSLSGVGQSRSSVLKAEAQRNFAWKNAAVSALHDIVMRRLAVLNTDLFIPNDATDQLKARILRRVTREAINDIGSLPADHPLRYAWENVFQGGDGQKGYRARKAIEDSVATSALLKDALTRWQENAYEQGVVPDELSIYTSALREINNKYNDALAKFDAQSAGLSEADRLAMRKQIIDEHTQQYTKTARELFPSLQTLTPEQTVTEANTISTFNEAFKPGSPAAVLAHAAEASTSSAVRDGVELPTADVEAGSHSRVSPEQEKRRARGSDTKGGVIASEKDLRDLEKQRNEDWERGRVVVGVAADMDVGDDAHISRLMPILRRISDSGGMLLIYAPDEIREDGKSTNIGHRIEAALRANGFVPGADFRVMRDFRDSNGRALWKKTLGALVGNSHRLIVISGDTTGRGRMLDEYATADINKSKRRGGVEAIGDMPYRRSRSIERDLASLEAFIRIKDDGSLTDSKDNPISSVLSGLGLGDLRDKANAANSGPAATLSPYQTDVERGLIVDGMEGGSGQTVAEAVQDVMSPDEVAQRAGKLAAKGRIKPASKKDIPVQEDKPVAVTEQDKLKAAEKALKNPELGKKASPKRTDALFEVLVHGASMVNDGMRKAYANRLVGINQTLGNVWTALRSNLGTTNDQLVAYVEQALNRKIGDNVGKRNLTPADAMLVLQYLYPDIRGSNALGMLEKLRASGADGTVEGGVVRAAQKGRRGVEELQRSIPLDHPAEPLPASPAATDPMRDTTPPGVRSVEDKGYGVVKVTTDTGYVAHVDSATGELVPAPLPVISDEEAVTGANAVAQAQFAADKKLADKIERDPLASLNAPNTNATIPAQLEAYGIALPYDPSLALTSIRKVYDAISGSHSYTIVDRLGNMHTFASDEPGESFLRLNDWLNKDGAELAARVKAQGGYVSPKFMMGVAAIGVASGVPLILGHAGTTAVIEAALAGTISYKALNDYLKWYRGNISPMANQFLQMSARSKFAKGPEYFFSKTIYRIGAVAGSNRQREMFVALTVAQGHLAQFVREKMLPAMGELRTQLIGESFHRGMQKLAEDASDPIAQRLNKRNAMGYLLFRLSTKAIADTPIDEWSGSKLIGLSKQHLEGLRQSNPEGYAMHGVLTSKLPEPERVDEALGTLNPLERKALQRVVVVMRDLQAQHDKMVETVYGHDPVLKAANSSPVFTSFIGNYIYDLVNESTSDATAMIKQNSGVNTQAYGDMLTKMTREVYDSGLSGNEAVRRLKFNFASKFGIDLTNVEHNRHLDNLARAMSITWESTRSIGTADAIKKMGRDLFLKSFVPSLVDQEAAPDVLGMLDSWFPRTARRTFIEPGIMKATQLANVIFADDPARRADLVSFLNDEKSGKGYLGDISATSIRAAYRAADLGRFYAMWARTTTFFQNISTNVVMQQGNEQAWLHARQALALMSDPTSPYTQAIHSLMNQYYVSDAATPLSEHGGIAHMMAAYLQGPAGMANFKGMIGERGRAAMETARELRKTKSLGAAASLLRSSVKAATAMGDLLALSEYVNHFHTFAQQIHAYAADQLVQQGGVWEQDRETGRYGIKMPGSQEIIDPYDAFFTSHAAQQGPHDSIQFPAAANALVDSKDVLNRSIVDTHATHGVFDSINHARVELAFRQMPWVGPIFSQFTTWNWNLLNSMIHDAGNAWYAKERGISDYDRSLAIRRLYRRGIAITAVGGPKAWSILAMVAFTGAKAWNWGQGHNAVTSWDDPRIKDFMAKIDATIGIPHFSEGPAAATFAEATGTPMMDWSKKYGVDLPYLNRFRTDEEGPKYAVSRLAGTYSSFADDVLTLLDTRDKTDVPTPIERYNAALRLMGRPLASAVMGVNLQGPALPQDFPLVPLSVLALSRYATDMVGYYNNDPIKSTLGSQLHSTPYSPTESLLRNFVAPLQSMTEATSNMRWRSDQSRLQQSLIFKYGRAKAENNTSEMEQANDEAWLKVKIPDPKDPTRMMGKADSPTGVHPIFRGDAVASIVRNTYRDAKIPDNLRRMMSDNLLQKDQDLGMVLATLDRAGYVTRDANGMPKVDVFKARRSTDRSVREAADVLAFLPQFTK